MKRRECPDLEKDVKSRIESEYANFKQKMLSSPASVIYESCSEIRFYECIYEYFSYSDGISRKHMEACLRCSSIIGSLYSLYLKYECLGCGTWEEIEEILNILEEWQPKSAERVKPCIGN